MSEIAEQIRSRQQASFNSLKEKRALWDDLEKLFHSQLNDAISLYKTQSNVFDPKLSTLTIERAYRVMGQLGIGKVKGISTNDMGDAKLKNLLLEKYVVPNANAQFDLLTKFRMVDLYSNIYGVFFALVDHDVKQNGYTGPDMWLLNIRDVFPQVGAVSLDDSDHVIVRTWKPLSYFEGLKKQDGYKNINQIVTKLKDLSGSKQNRDSEAKSKREEDQYSGDDPAKKAGYFEALTQFERDRWVDYCVDADLEFRDQKNPHEDGDLPVKAKYSIPLLDDFMGLGDFERGKGMQMAVNANWNSYFDSVALSQRPPVAINLDQVASKSSIRPIAGAQWLFRTGQGTVANAIHPVNLSPQGIATFNNTHQVANASLLNLFGTSDTAVTQETDPGMGKTPRALAMQQARENTRDNADRFYMEQFVTQVMKKMVNLLSKKQSSAISIRMFPDELEQLAREFPEVKENYDERSGKLSIPKGKNTMYDYELVSGSTYAIDQKAQQENLQMMMQLWLQTNTPQGNILEAKLKEDGYNLKFGELFKKTISNSGIQDWDKILEEMTDEEKQQDLMGQVDQAGQQFAMAAQQMMQNPNQTPEQQVQPTDMQGMQGM
jgi:hypothetical protein